MCVRIRYLWYAQDRGGGGGFLHRAAWSACTPGTVLTLVGRGCYVGVHASVEYTRLPAVHTTPDWHGKGGEEVQRMGGKKTTTTTQCLLARFCSFVRSFVRWFVGSFVGSFVRSFVRSLVRSLIRAQRMTREERERTRNRKMDIYGEQAVSLFSPFSLSPRTADCCNAVAESGLPWKHTP
jgi:hypothetical protein